MSETELHRPGSSPNHLRDDVFIMLLIFQIDIQLVLIMMEEVSWQLVFPPFAASKQSQRLLETFPPQSHARHVFVTEPLQLCWINIRKEDILVPKKA